MRLTSFFAFLSSLVMYQGSSNSFFVTLLEGEGDQPLLDTYFPDTGDKRRGYQLSA
jgi:hypothetical protein